MRLAIFGGTFDPVHRAHVTVASAARDSFDLERVLMIPAAHPPHKRHRLTAAYEHRLRMVELACSGQPGLEPSSLEAGTERSYSIITIERVRQTLQSGDKLFFLIGSDAFADLATWHRWQDVTQSVEFIVVTRPGHGYTPIDGAVTHHLETLAMNVSSSDIRHSLSRGVRPDDLHDEVFEYIRANRLYGFPPSRT